MSDNQPHPPSCANTNCYRTGPDHPHFARVRPRLAMSRHRHGLSTVLFCNFLILINWLQLQSNVYGVYFGLLPYMLNSSTWTSCVTLNSAYERWSGYFKVKTKGLEAAFGCWICLLMPTGIFNNNIHHDNCIPVYVAVSHSVQTLPRFRVGSGLFIKMTIFLRLLMIFSISYRSEAGKFVLLC